MFSALLTRLKKQQKKHLDEVSPEQKKEHISQNTWHKIEERDRMTKDKAPSEDIKRLSKEITKYSKQDKHHQLLEQFNENPTDRNKVRLWKSVIGLKKKFSPQFVRMKNLEGKHVPLTRRAEAIAEYLDKERWQNNDSDHVQPLTNPICRNVVCNESDFTKEELKSQS